jgi:hypothetical protein
LTSLGEALNRSVNLYIIIYLMGVIATFVVLIREDCGTEDPGFEGEKLIYRS